MSADGQRLAVGRPLRWFLALTLACAFAALAWEKAERGKAIELLWTCHVATAVTLLGLLFGRARLIACGCLFHLAIGFPAFIMQELFVEPATLESWLVHIWTPLAGLLALRGTRLPRWVPGLTLGLQLATLAAARLLTPPELNVNLAWGVFGGVRNWFSALWQMHVANTLVTLLILSLAWTVWRWFWQRHELRQVLAEAQAS